MQQWKIDEVKEILELLKTYKNIAVLNVAKMSDLQLQNMRKLLRGKAIIKMSKRSLQRRAIEAFQKESNKANLDYFAEKIPPQAMFVFTNKSLFEIKDMFQTHKTFISAKPNEITPVDIWVPAGDTGLPTGQVISELNMTLKLPTRVQNDTIWVKEDTLTHSAGDLVEVKQAAVLKKLGVRPIESMLKIDYAWVNGTIYTSDIIYLDAQKFQREVADCFAKAQRLAMELGVIDKETLEPLTQKAHREALALLFELPIFIEEMCDEYIRKAATNANTLNAVVFGEGIAAATSPATATPQGDKSKGKKEDKKEGESEATGIGGLF